MESSIKWSGVEGNVCAVPLFIGEHDTDDNTTEYEYETNCTLHEAARPGSQLIGPFIDDACWLEAHHLQEYPHFTSVFNNRIMQCCFHEQCEIECDNFKHKFKLVPSAKK